MNVGIIGLGIGESHISLFNACEGVKVTHLCDTNPIVLERAKEKYSELNIQFTLDEDDILKSHDIDAVSIASYDDKHFNQIRKAYEFGKHVFVEKPIVTKEEDLRQLEDLFATKPFIQISSNLALRSNKVLKKLKQDISSNDMGELSMLELQYNYGRLNKLTQGWRGDIPNYSITIGGGIHISDLLLWLNAPHKPVSVSAVGNKFHSRGSKFKGNDIVVSQLKFDNGSIALLNMNFGGVSPHYHRIEVVGTKKTFIHEFDRDYLFVKRDVKNKDSNHFLNDLSLFGKYQGRVNFGADYEIDRSDNNISDFVSSIRETRNPYLTKQQIIDAMNLCFCIDRSVLEEKTVSI